MSDDSQFALLQHALAIAEHSTRASSIEKILAAEVRRLEQERDTFKAAHNETDMLLGCAKDLCADLKARADRLESDAAALRKALDGIAEMANGEGEPLELLIAVKRRAARALKGQP